MAKELNETELQREVEEIKAAADRMWNENKKQIQDKLPASGKVVFRRLEHAFKEVYHSGFYNGGWYFEQRKDKSGGGVQ